MTVGHLTQLSYVPLEEYSRISVMVAHAGIAVTVLPSTNLFLMGRNKFYAQTRGVLPLEELIERGVACSVATNNVLNAFTPYGDGSLIRMANLYANTCHVSRAEGLSACFNLVTSEAARVIGVTNYGIAVGHAAHIVLLDAPDPAGAVAEIAPPLWGLKAGRPTFSRARPQIYDRKG